MLQVADREIERIKHHPDSYEKELTKEASDLIKLLEQENKPKRAVEVKARSDAWAPTVIKPQAATNLRAWKDRKAEIRAAMNGVVEAESVGK